MRSSLDSHPFIPSSSDHVTPRPGGNAQNAFQDPNEPTAKEELASLQTDHQVK